MRPVMAAPRIGLEQAEAGAQQFRQLEAAAVLAAGQP